MISIKVQKGHCEHKTRSEVCNINRNSSYNNPTVYSNILSYAAAHLEANLVYVQRALFQVVMFFK